MMDGKIYRYLAAFFPLFILFIPLSTLAAVCNTVDGVIYGYGLSTGCGTAGPGDDICDALGSGGGGCTAVDIAPGSPYEITVGIQNQGGVADRYQISWTPPAGWSIVMEERLNDGSVVEYPTSVTAQAYVGRVDPATATPAAAISASDSTWSSFTQVNVNGGYDYDTDDVRVNAFDTPATGYILKYSTKYIVDDTVTPGMGEVSFTDAISAQGLGLPQSPGSQECYTIQVQNILTGNDGIPGTLDDIDRTPNTQFFFAVKARDENYNLAPLSNIASGLTAMSSYLYNMVSVPKVPSPNDPASVFGDDVGSQLYLYRWDSRGIDNAQGCYDGVPGQYNPYNVVPACTGISAINEGKGYFLWSPVLNVVLDAPSGSTEVCANPSLCICVDEIGRSFTCYTFLLNAGGNMFGNPFGKEVDVERINVQDPVGSVKSFQNAVATGWIEGAIYTHNGINYTDEACNSVRCDAVLQPWKGYWIWVKGGQGYKLLIPKP